jgi:hypothetical protein
MKALLNYAPRAHQFPRSDTSSITIPAAVTETLRGVHTRTPGVAVVSDALAAELQAHDIAGAWFGPEGVVAVPVTEMS